ncbi:uncharacterized protein [Mytilus edulis]|uniref:uncharacterized protein n=1 Tax=Mytilus edulis TaxID=6550 RepID=UPI0039EFDD88
MAAAPSQPTVYEPSDAQYGLFYWIHLSGKALDNCNTVQNIVKSCSRIQHTAQRVEDPTGLKVGVGFGKKFLKKITEILKRKQDLQGLRENFMLHAGKVEYQDWKIGKKTVLPSKGGDIFVHAKGNNVGTLYEFQHVFFNTLPHKSVDPEKSSITRGFKFQHHRDISGYMDGEYKLYK